MSFYISRAVDGGCCDCGDESAWDRSGFCSKHGRIHTRGDTIASLPFPLPHTAPVLFGGILEELMLFTVHIKGHWGYERQRVQALEKHAPLLIEAVKWLTHKCCQFEGLALLAAQAFFKTPGLAVPHVAQNGLPRPLREMNFYYAGEPHSRSAPPDEPRPAASHEPKDTPSEDTADDFPSIDGSLLERLILADLDLRTDSPELARALQALYLRLISEPTFKRAFAACYTTNYLSLTTQHFTATLPASEETLVSSQVDSKTSPARPAQPLRTLAPDSPPPRLAWPTRPGPSAHPAAKPRSLCSHVSTRRRRCPGVLRRRRECSHVLRRRPAKLSPAYPFHTAASALPIVNPLPVPGHHHHPMLRSSPAPQPHPRLHALHRLPDSATLAHARPFLSPCPPC